MTTAKPRLGGTPDHPFSIETLRQLLMTSVLKQSQRPPAKADLHRLVISLNRIAGTFAFAVHVANASKPMAAEAQNAIDVLVTFFKRRQQEASRYKGSDIAQREADLATSFNDFLRKLIAHKFDLDMDVGLTMPVIDHWHDVAERVASDFKIAMIETMGPRNLGLSNEGPIPRFVAAVIPQITGEHPSVGAVGKFLKERAKQSQ